MFGKKFQVGLKIGVLRKLSCLAPLSMTLIEEAK